MHCVTVSQGGSLSPPKESSALQHKTSARDRIIASAKQLFGEHGFHQTAMADLAETAQVSVGTIYRTFPGKSEIIRAIIVADTQETLDELQADIARVEQGEAERGAAVNAMIMRCMSKHGEALAHEIVAECHRNAELAELIVCVCGKFRDQLRVLARLLQPKADAVQIEGAAELFLACLFGMGSREFTKPVLGDAQTAAAVTDLILKALD
jgi:TetR/AcrR family transcriptional repressor of uid operon